MDKQIRIDEELSKVIGQEKGTNEREQFQQVEEKLIDALEETMQVEEACIEEKSEDIKINYNMKCEDIDININIEEVNAAEDETINTEEKDILQEEHSSSEEESEDIEIDCNVECEDINTEEFNSIGNETIDHEEKNTFKEEHNIIEENSDDIKIDCNMEYEDKDVNIEELNATGDETINVEEKSVLQEEHSSNEENSEDIKMDYNMEYEDADVNIEELNTVGDETFNYEKRSVFHEEHNSVEKNSDIKEENHEIDEDKNKYDNDDIEKRRIRKKKIMKWSVISVASLLLIYLGVSAYFVKHFYFGTTINTIAVSGKTVEAVNEELAADTEKYTLTLEGRDGVKEEISASEMGIKYNSQDKVQELIDSQNPFKWIVGIFSKTDSQISDMFSFDEKLLKESVDKLSYFDKAKIIEPKSASLKRTDKGYEIIKEVKGNKINRDVLYEQIVSAILDEKQVLSLEDVNCYENPKYTSDSKEVIEAQASLNKYIGVTVTYNFTEGKEVLNGATINNWLKIDDNFKVSFDEEVKSYINKLGNTYDTLGKPRDFKTTSGRTVKVSGGYYGVSINRTKETQELINIIKEGKSISRKPIYSQNEEENSGNGIGNTYVEIDLTNQHMWFYKNGKLITHGNVVTGNADSKHSTPAGLYKITYKQKNAILRGPGYAAPVSFWMPFNGDIGIHDATWRSSFGGNIYKNDGSHGCVNSPYGVAEAIFNSIQAGDPVVCYH